MRGSREGAGPAVVVPRPHRPPVSAIGANSQPDGNDVGLLRRVHARTREEHMTVVRVARRPVRDEELIRGLRLAGVTIDDLPAERRGAGNGERGGVVVDRQVCGRTRRVVRYRTGGTEPRRRNRERNPDEYRRDQSLGLAQHPRSLPEPRARARQVRWRQRALPARPRGRALASYFRPLLGRDVGRGGRLFAVGAVALAIGGRDATNEPRPGRSSCRRSGSSSARCNARRGLRAVAAGDEGHDRAPRARAPGAARPVDIRSAVFGEVEVDHATEVFDVDTTSGHVGRDERDPRGRS